jgi:hypothetical protein
MKNCDWLLKATLGIAACAAVGCMPSINQPDYGPLNSAFAVSDFFSPSGFMGDGANPGFLTVDFGSGAGERCKQPRPPGAQGNCYSFTYFMDGEHDLRWAGAYWVFPTNSWGSRPGYAFDATKFTHVRFYAALDTPQPATADGGGTTFFNAIAGGINGKGFYGPPCKSVHDHYATDATGQLILDMNGKPTRCEHDDTFRAEEIFQIGTDIGPDYKQFRIPLTLPIMNAMVTTGKLPDEIVGAFAWSIPFPSDSCTCNGMGGISAPNCRAMQGKVDCPFPVKVYIDDIVWETAPLPTP